jgi:site-specific DNA-cytosine methylase
MNNRLIKFLNENKWGGAEGLDLYNHTYFTQVHPAITTRTVISNNYFIMEEPINDQHGCARTIKAQYNKTSRANLQRDDSFGATGATDGYRVRKLTPRECFRLMGVTDSDADKMIGVLSKSRCYQVAGNSIVVDVLAAIFSQLFIENKNKHQQMELF